MVLDVNMRRYRAPYYRGASRAPFEKANRDITEMW